MRGLARGLVAAVLLAGAAPALAADRYVVSYATREDEGPALTVVSVVTLDTADASDDALRAAFTARLEGRKERFLPDVAVFDTQAEAFRTGLLGRAAASGAVMRGGHFYDGAGDVRAASRRQAGWTFLHYRFISPNGIRLVLEKAEAAGRPQGYGSSVFRALQEWQRSLEDAKDGAPPPPAGKPQP